MRLPVLLCALLLLGSAAAHCSLLAPTPTQKLNAERAAAAQAQAQQAAAKAGTVAQRLKPPCFVPVSGSGGWSGVAGGHCPPAPGSLHALLSLPCSAHCRVGLLLLLPTRPQVSYYPVRACAASNDAAVCGRGFNAWRTYEQCCARQRGPVGAFPEGCTNTHAQVGVWQCERCQATAASAALRPCPHADILHPARPSPLPPAAELLGDGRLPPAPDVPPVHRLCRVQPQLGPLGQ